MLAPTLRSSGLAIAVSLAALALTLGARSAESASYRSCGLTGSDARPPSGKPTYNIGLKQLRTRCTTAKKVMKAFHACRSAEGLRCTRKVLATWTCSGRKTAGIPTTFYARFTCGWGTRRVVGTYQQNTPGG